MGVVRDGKNWTLEGAIGPTFFVPLQREPMRDMALVEPDQVRPQRPQSRAADARAKRCRGRHAFDRRGLRTLPAQIGAVVTTTLGAMATMLAAIDIYGPCRSRSPSAKEIGIRKAVGAHTRDIMRLVVASSLIRVGARLAVGLLLGGLTARALQGLSSVSRHLTPSRCGSAAVTMIGVAAAQA